MLQGGGVLIENGQVTIINCSIYANNASAVSISNDTLASHDVLKANRRPIVVRRAEASQLREGMCTSLTAASTTTQPFMKLEAEAS